MSLERSFDPSLVAGLASAEKQVQQAYRPVIQLHKWFARRPGTLFRGLLVSHFGPGALAETFFDAHDLTGVVLDPFQGGGTTLWEANRLGLSVVGYDTNPLSRWINERAFEPLDVEAYLAAGEAIAEAVEAELGQLYVTECEECSKTVPVKFWVWVKTHVCTRCETETLLLSNTMLAGPGMKRHTHEVHVCGVCRNVAQFLAGEMPACCPACGTQYALSVIGRSAECRGCGETFASAPKAATHPPHHTLVALEYHCENCKRREGRRGRFFKGADIDDHTRFAEAVRLRDALGASLYWPTDPIEQGDESSRLLRWGYRDWSQLHNERQLVGLHHLAAHIRRAPAELRPALATTFSDLIRYQNLVCRYDPAALKVLDVFSIHGFPVNRVQCEAALIGIPGVGSGAWRHWLVKYAAAKRWCEQPFETRRVCGRNQRVLIPGERVEGRLIERPEELAGKRTVLLRVGSISSIPLPPDSVDLVATDPPFADSVQYSELLDYPYAWLRRLVDPPYFAPPTTRSGEEASANTTAGRELEHYAEALSGVYRAATRALKPGQPFVFTFHDNDINAYGAVAVALLDSGLVPSCTIGCPSEMRGSIHINATGSSRVDTVFVLRKPPAELPHARAAADVVVDQVAALEDADVHVSAGDRRCLTFGALTEAVVRALRDSWTTELPTAKRLELACDALTDALTGSASEEAELAAESA